jgi:hypothetical protein
MTSMRWLAVPLLVGASLLSCSEGPVAGELEVILETSRSDLGAIRFVILSAEPAAVETLTAGCPGCALFQNRVATTEVRGIITGDLTAGTVMRLQVPDLALAASYAISVQEAATQSYDALPPAGIVLRVAIQ